MNYAFYIAAAVAAASTALVITRKHVVHSLLYLIVSLLAVAVVFFTLGAPLAAALEVIIYAGAIMVLFVFVIMMLNLGKAAQQQERAWLTGRVWVGPGLLAAVLLGELLWALSRGLLSGGPAGEVPPLAVGRALYGPYVLGLELASMILLAALVGAFHLGRRWRGGEGPQQKEQPL